MQLIVSENKSSKRIDKFLAEEFFSYTRGEIIRQIKAGHILVNGKKVKPSYILKENDIITIINSQKTTDNSQGIIPNPRIKLEIIYQNKNIIAVNKPAGIQVHPDSHEKKNTLANALVASWPEIKNVGEDLLRPGIVHRLDKDTSGIIIIARNQEAFFELKKKFKNREIEKTYLAIVPGKITKPGEIEKPIARATSYRKQVIAGKKTRTKIREAVTHYKVLKSGENFSLLEVQPKTGRMHQIRVHLATIGHPIVGDKIYKLKKIKSENMASRQLLHAKSISFELFGKNYAFETRMPNDFNQFLTKNR